MVNSLAINNKKKKVKRLSSTRYYPSDYISNPCDQLFGPPLDSSLNHNDSHTDELNVSTKSVESNKTILVENNSHIEQSVHNVHTSSSYIPAPRWNRAQNCILEDTFKNSRFPKQSELKQLAQRLNVMESDVEVITFLNCFM